MSSEFKKTPFYDTHVALGAQMAPFGGYMMPIRYQGIIQEHQACRKGAVLFDTCHMGEFTVKGPRALVDLESLVSCDVASMADGQCRYGMLCNEAGGVIDDLLVYRRTADDFMLVVNAGTQDNDFLWVQSHLSAGTSLKNISGATAKFDLQGPGSAKILQQIVDKPVDGLKFYRFMDNAALGAEVIVSRTGYTGELGFELYTTPEVLIKLWNRCVELGAVPAGLGARDTLRLEMGMPLYGHELDSKRNAAESGFSRALSTTKRFVGSDVVREASKKLKTLVGIRLEGRRAARNGDVIIDEAGRAVGEVTSGSFAPSLDVAIAMGYVEKSLSGAGCRILIQTVRQNIPGVVCGLPFYEAGTARNPLKNFL